MSSRCDNHGVGQMLRILLVDSSPLRMYAHLVPRFFIHIMATVFNIKGNVYVKQHIEAGGHGVYNDYGSQSFNPIPEALQTPRATEILKRLNEAGYLTESFQPAEDKSWAVMSIVAYEIGKALGLSNKFAPFEELWHHNNLSKNYDGALNTNSKVNEIAQIIREIIHI